MKAYIKWLIFVFVAIIVGMIVSHYSETVSWHESTTMIIALLALLRSCEEKK